MPLAESSELSELEDIKARITEIVMNCGYNAHVEEIGNFVISLMETVAKLEPRQLAEGSVPAALLEAEAITKTLEEAAGKIMDVAERVGEIAENADGETQEKLMDISTDLFETTSFQDLCGQRTSKVEELLQGMVPGLQGLADCVGDNNLVVDEDTVKYDEKGHVENEETLLHGPQNEGEGNSQEDIDALLASFD